VQSKGGSIQKSRPHKYERRMCTAFPPPPWWADMPQHFVVEPHPRAPTGPFVLDSLSKLRSNALVTYCVKVHAAELQEHITSVDLHFLRLIVQLVALRKTITAWHSAKAHYRPKVHRQLGKSIRGQLVELHPKPDQNVGKDRLRRHPEPSCEKLFKHNSFVLCWLQNNLFPRLSHGTFGEIAQRDQLPNATNHNGRRPKYIAMGGLKQVHSFAPPSFISVPSSDIPSEVSLGDEWVDVSSGQGTSLVFRALTSLTTGERSPSIAHANRKNKPRNPQKSRSSQLLAAKARKQRRESLEAENEVKNRNQLLLLYIEAVKTTP
jgi:hypothetical protein